MSRGAQLRGNFDRAVKVVGIMLALPNLKQVVFPGYLDPFVELVIKNNQAKKDIISVVPFQRKEH